MNPLTILVIDDHAVNLKLVSDLLELEGYIVLRCSDAESAIEMLKKNIPDLILMDIALPGMDGLQLTRIIKADHRTKDVRIIALTAFAMPGDKDRVLEAGCDGYITKPIDTRSFKSQIDPFL